MRGRLLSLVLGMYLRVELLGYLGFPRGSAVNSPPAEQKLQGVWVWSLAWVDARE